MEELTLLPRAERQLLQAVRGRQLRPHGAGLGPGQPHLRAAGRRSRGVAALREPRARRRRQPVPRRRGDDRRRAARHRERARARARLRGERLHLGQAARAADAARRRHAARRQRGRQDGVRGGRRRPLRQRRPGRARRLRRRPSPTGSVSVASSASETLPRPRIGITTYLEQARWGAWDQPAVLLPHAYVAAVHRAGGVPVLLPPLPDGAAEALAGVHGLLVAGGADVDAERYGAVPLEGSDPPRRDRDAWELALLAEALGRGRPGAGRVPRRAGAERRDRRLAAPAPPRRRGPRGPPAGARPARSRAGGGRARQRAGRCHRPGCRRALLPPPGDGPAGPRPARRRRGPRTGRSRRSSCPGPHFVLGVQWHPELDAHDDRLFVALVQAARQQLVPPRQEIPS